MNKFNHPVFHFTLIGLAVFMLYWQTTGFDFVLDDKIVVTDNSFVQKGIQGIREIFWNDSMTGFLGEQPDLLAGGRYRPLSIVVFALIFQFAGLNPFWYHLANIVFYLISCLIVYRVLKVLFYKQKESQLFKLLVFLATILFAMHPVHTEAVANVKGLDEILAFLFGMMTFIFVFLYYDQKK